MIALSGLRLGGYRSFGSLQEMSDFDKLNIFAGQNNAGKSTVLRFLHEQLKPLQSGHRRTGSSQLNNLTDAHRGIQPYPLTVGVPLSIDSETARSLRDQTEANNHRAARLFDRLFDAEGKFWIDWTTADSGNSYVVTDGSLNEIKPRLQPAEWSILWQALKNAGGGNLDMWVSDVISTLDPLTTVRLPHIAMVPAIRQISAAETDGDDFSGLGLVHRLARLQNPPFGREDDQDTFRTIRDFLRAVTGFEDAELEVPVDRDTILVRRLGQRFPLESLGTGIHEVVILAAASTVLRNQIVCMEEPEIHLHPVLQRLLIQYLVDKTSNQYFITTHSPHILDSRDVITFHVTHEEGASKVQRIGNLQARHALAVDLGVRASDLVQANCVIWVEGPSDRLYIKWWLNAMDDSLKEGVHFSIMFFGGRLMNHLSAEQLDATDRDLIRLLTVNQFSFMVFDSDKKRSGERINATKKRLTEEFKGNAWTTKGREIENYLNVAALREIVSMNHLGAQSCAQDADPYQDALQYRRSKDGMIREADKMRLAEAITKGIPDLSILDLRKKLGDLVAFVYRANGMA